MFEMEKFKILGYSSHREDFTEKNPKTLKLAGSKHQASMLQKRLR